MDDFQYVRTLRGAIYGKVALVQHRQSSRLYAMKMMSIAHMSARQAISGPSVCEDGDAELRILRRLSGNRVFYSSVSGGDGDDVPGEPVAVIESSWSVRPQWEANELKSSPLDCFSPQGERVFYQEDQQRYHHHDHHNNILLLHKDFVDEGISARCLVLDYCPYGELYDQVQLGNTALAASGGGSGAGFEAARSYFQQIARAVHFIHAHNIAHRDISLENVLLDEQRQCRLADFGLASEHGVRCAGRVGKTFYMAPEVLLCQQHECYDGLKADIWSLGVLLFILVTGAPPFETPGDSDARFRVVTTQGVGQLLCIWQMENRVSDELRDLLAQMLCVDAQERISIDEVCSHPWLMQASVDYESLMLEGHQCKQEGDGCNGYDMLQSSEQAQLEPHEEDDLEKEPSLLLLSGADGSVEATRKSRRMRKRMKISIVSDFDSGVVNSDDSFPFAFASSFSDATDGYSRESWSVAPALAHENSPWKHEATSSLFAPHTTPTAGPRTRTGGRKVTLRSLCFNSGDGVNSSNNVDDSNDEEEKFASTRRRRTSLSLSCAAMITKSLENRHQASECPPAPKCRICMDELVEEEDHPHDDNKTTTAASGRRPNSGHSVLSLCESCFYTMPPLNLTLKSETNVLVLRKAASRSSRRPVQVV